MARGPEKKTALRGSNAAGRRKGRAVLRALTVYDGRPVRKADMDRLCREVVLMRHGQRCARCGSVRGLQWCHVYSRRYLSVRWDLENSFAACAACHWWWHDRPIEAADWWRERVGDERYRALILRAKTALRPDYDAVFRGLLAERDRLLLGGARI